MKNAVTYCAIAVKLIRAFYTMLTKGVDYDPKKWSVTSRDQQSRLYRLRKKDK